MSTALAALLEALDFSDVIAEIGHANWTELFEGMRIERLPTAREFGQGIPIVLAPVAAGGLPTVIERTRNPNRPARITRNINHTHIEARTPSDVPLPGGNVSSPRGIKRKKKALAGRPTRFHRRNPVTSPAVRNNPELDRLISRVKRTRSRSRGRVSARPGKTSRNRSISRYTMPAGVRPRRRSKKKTRTRRRISTGVMQNYLGTTKSVGSRSLTKTRIFYAPVATDGTTGIQVAGLIDNTRLGQTGSGSHGRFFKAADFPDFNTYKPLYQFYKILSVKVIWYPQQNSYSAFSGNQAFNSQAAATTSFAPEIIVAEDRMSAAAFASRDAAFAHEGATFHMFNDSKEFAVTIRPTAVQQSGPTGSQVNVPGKPMWIPTTADAVPHNGLRIFYSNFNQFTSFRVMYQMKVAFKGLKT